MKCQICENLKSYPENELKIRMFSRPQPISENLKIKLIKMSAGAKPGSNAKMEIKEILI